MRVAFFGSGGQFSQVVLQAVAARHEVVAVITPGREAGLVRRALGGMARAAGLGHDAMHGLVARIGAVRHRARSGTDPSVADLLARLRPDVGVIALYPWILPPTVFDATRLGTVNLHLSLLPRHRGPLPLFWVYWRDDRRSGVTAHRVTAAPDAGRVLAQATLEVPRGQSVDELYERKVELAGPLATDTLAAIEQGDDGGVPQDESLATAAPRIAAGRSMVEPSWPAERVWHFLAGLHTRFREPIQDERGVGLSYDGVLGFREEAHGVAPGSAVREGAEIRLYCVDGFVRLAPDGPGAPTR